MEFGNVVESRRSQGDGNQFIVVGELGKSSSKDEEGTNAGQVD